RECFVHSPGFNQTVYPSFDRLFAFSRSFLSNIFLRRRTDSGVTSQYSSSSKYSRASSSHILLVLPIVAVCSFVSVRTLVNLFFFFPFIFVQYFLSQSNRLSCYLTIFIIVQVFKSLFKRHTFGFANRSSLIFCCRTNVG